MAHVCAHLRYTIAHTHTRLTQTNIYSYIHKYTHICQHDLRDLVVATGARVYLRWQTDSATPRQRGVR